MNDTLLIAVLLVVGFMQVVMFYLLIKKRGGSENNLDNISKRLDDGQKLMVETIQKQSSESNRIVSDITIQLTQIKESNKQVVTITDELKTLKNIFNNPKQRGVLGEYYLQTVLDNVLPPELFTMQYKFNDGETVDAVIYLDDKKLLPIDSKFSLENYNRLVEAKSEDEKNKYIKLFKTDLKNRIDETAKYIRPDENTMDFAFMFIPSEAIYYDLLSNKIGISGASDRDLIEYAHRDKKVIIVSPTSFMAYLQTVLQGLRSLQIEEKAKEIQAGVIKLGRHIASFEEYMLKLGNSLGVSVSHYNTAHKELKKVDTDISKIADTTKSVEPLELDRPDN